MNLRGRLCIPSSKLLLAKQTKIFVVKNCVLNLFLSLILDI